LTVLKASPQFWLKLKLGYDMSVLLRPNKWATPLGSTELELRSAHRPQICRATPSYRSLLLSRVATLRHPLEVPYPRIVIVNRPGFIDRSPTQ
jgi:hypothetical protein